MQITTGSATVTWASPTRNADDSLLAKLAGYWFYYGASPGSYANRILVDHPGVKTYVVDSLVPNTRFSV